MDDGIPPQDSPEPDGFTRQPPPASPSAPTPPPGYGSAAPQVFAEESQAVLAICMSVIGIFLCGGALSPFGWHLGKKELDGIASGHRDPSKRNVANAAKIIGMIGSVYFSIILVLAAITLVFVLIGLLGAASEGIALFA